MLYNLLQMRLKLILKKLFKTAEATGSWIGKKIANKITNPTKTLPKNTSEILEAEAEIPTEKYIYPEKRQQIKFKTLFLKSSLCYYSNAYTLFHRTTRKLPEEEQTK